MIKAVIFDFFGVVLTGRLEEVYEHFGGDFKADEEFVYETLHRSHTGQIERSSHVFAEHLGVSIEEFEAEYDSKRMVNVELIAYINSLRTVYKVALLSNVGKRGVVAYIDQDLLDKTFDVVVESSKIGFAKPQPEAFQITCERLGVDPTECAFVDDRERYLVGAKQLGMQTVHYQNFAQCKADLEAVLSS